MSGFCRRFANLEALKSAAKPKLFELLPDRHSPTIESRQVLTKPLRRFCALQVHPNSQAPGLVCLNAVAGVSAPPLRTAGEATR